MEKIVNVLTKTLQNIEHGPGIYKFFDQQHRLLYVGKAIDLSRRVKQYFSSNKKFGPKTIQLVKQIASIETLPTASEFDALLLEARLIHTYQPKYNIIAKDDKSPLYIAISKHIPLPYIQSLRKSAIEKNIYDVFGPFQSGRTARNVLRTIRHIIPFCTQKKRNGKPCFYTHIGLCNPCPSVLIKMKNSHEKADETNRYKKNIHLIRSILNGNINSVSRQLKREMDDYAGRELFEKASERRNQILHIHALLAKRYDPEVYLQGDHMLENMNETELVGLQNILHPYISAISSLTRIECVDISTLSGTHSTGSVVVLTNGLIDRSEYRRFKIRNTQNINDIVMMREVIARRLKHTEWPYPNLLIVDGGKTQIHAVAHVLKEARITIPLIGLAKRFETIYAYTDKGTMQEIRLPLDSPALHIVERIRDEAHRFAHTYQQYLRTK